MSHLKLDTTSTMNKLFLKLHEIQINLIKNPNKHIVNEYYKQLDEFFSNDYPTLTNVDVKPVLEFLILPILSSLKKLNTSDSNHRVNEFSDLNESLLKCMLILIENFQPIELNLFNDVLNICSILLSRTIFNEKSTASSSRFEYRVSDEFLSTCFRLIHQLFTQSSAEIVESFYKFSSLTTIGLLIAKLLDILSESNSLQVRMDALMAFKSILISIDCNNNNNDQISKLRIGVIYASFLPGISIKLVQNFLLAENVKLLNHKLICLALDALSMLVTNVFNDFLLDEENFKRCFNACRDNNQSTAKSKEIESLAVNRCEKKDWLTISSEKLFILIERLLENFIYHENEQVKLALIRFCSQVSDKCYFSLNVHLDKLLKLLVTCAVYGVTGADDDDNRIVSEATMAIEKLENKETSNKYKIIQPNRFSLVSSAIQELLLKLPRLMAKTDSNIESSDESRIGYLRTVYGYLRLIGNSKKDGQVHLNEFFQASLQNLFHLLDALINCVKFDYKSLNNFFELNNFDNRSKLDEDLNLSNYKGLETYLQDRVVFEQLRIICKYLGKSDSAHLIIDQLLNSDLVFIENRKYKLEAMFLIDLILLGLDQKIRSDKNNENLQIVQLVLSNNLNDLKQTSESKCDQIESITLDQSITVGRNRAILQTCLTLEAISTTSHCLSQNSDDFNNLFLIETLYFTLENYLSANLLIKCVAKECLGELAKNLNYKSVQDLLSSNYDFIMNDLILKSTNLKRKMTSTSDFNKQSSHVNVLCALISVSNSDLCPHLERLIDDYFFSAQINSSNVEIIDDICKIVGYMAKSMRVWYPVKFNFVSDDDNYELSSLSLEKYVNSKKANDAKKSFLESVREVDSYFIKIENEKSYSEEKDEVQTDLDAKEESETKPVVPLHVKFQTKSLELCTHLISHPNREIRLKVIDIIRELSKNLAEHTNEYLPLVHKLWSPICHRFSLDDFVVKARIVYALFDLSILCGDFLGSRFVKEFLPRLKQFMTEQSKQSAKGDNPTYIYTQIFKLQCAVLINMDKLCVIMDIKEMELESLLEAIVLPYLDKRQPKRLQSLSVDSLQNYALIDPDTVWLSLHYVIPNSRSEIENINIFKENYIKSIKPKFNFQLADEVLIRLIDIFKII